MAFRTALRWACASAFAVAAGAAIIDPAAGADSYAFDNRLRKAQDEREDPWRGAAVQLPSASTMANAGTSTEVSTDELMGATGHAAIGSGFSGPIGGGLNGIVGGVNGVSPGLGGIQSGLGGVQTGIDAVSNSVGALGGTFGGIGLR